MHIGQESEKRIPDIFDMYIYNDFAGYGMAEVFENAVSIHTISHMTLTADIKIADRLQQRIVQERHLTSSEMGTY